MKHTVKGDSIVAFLREVLLYPKSANSASDNDGPYLLRGNTTCFGDSAKELHIRQNQGVDVGDSVVFEFREQTNVTSTKVNSKIEYKCVEFDSVSHKLVIKE